MELLKTIGFFVIMVLVWQWAATKLQSRGWPTVSRHLAGILAGFFVAVLTVGLNEKTDEMAGKKSLAFPYVSTLFKTIADADRIFLSS